MRPDSAPPGLTTRLCQSASELAELAPAWRKLSYSQDAPELQHEPAWVDLEVASKVSGQAAALALSSDDRLIGVLPFVIRPWLWEVRLAYRRLAALPVRLADVCGDRLLMPEDAEAIEAMLRGVASEEVAFDLMFFESLPVSSLLAQLLAGGLADRVGLRLHAPRPPQPHWTLQLGRTFDDYLGKFSGDRRRKLRWAVRHFDSKAGGPVTVERVTDVDQVGSFLARAHQLSERTWQGARLGQLVPDDPREQAKLEGYARRGWLRSYLMSVAGEPVAFVVGWQHLGTYTYERIGYDQRLAQLSPGNVLLFKLIEDLHEDREARVETIDFGAGDNAYKRLYGTTSGLAQDLYLVRRSPRLTLGRGLQLATVRSEAAARSLLERTGLKERLGRWLRRG